MLVLGLANLMADGFAMGAGNYSATKAELDDYGRLLAIERKHIALEPSGEREEIRQIFGLKGFSGAELERIVDVISSDEDLWAKTMAIEEYGLSPAVKSVLPRRSDCGPDPGGADQSAGQQRRVNRVLGAAAERANCPYLEARLNGTWPPEAEAGKVCLALSHHWVLFSRTGSCGAYGRAPRSAMRSKIGRTAPGG